MNSTDIGFWVATAAAVVAAVYTALGYHRPTGIPVAKPAKTGQSVVQPQSYGLKRQALVLILLGAISWGGALFAYYTRSPERATEYPISTENADVDIRLWAKGTPNAEITTYFANAYTVNRGKLTATNFTHIGIGAVGGSIPSPLLDSIFLSFRAQLKLLPVPTDSIRVGQDTLWFSIFGPPVSADLSKGISDGTQVMYFFNVMRYRDDRTPPGKYIYTENCIYFAKEVAHVCEGGHNRSYISD